jgi:hypothetical protein
MATTSTTTAIVTAVAINTFTTVPSVKANAVNVNFIFANYDKKVVLTTTLSSSGADLKSQLLENWPEGAIIVNRVLALCVFFLLFCWAYTTKEVGVMYWALAR